MWWHYAQYALLCASWCTLVLYVLSAHFYSNQSVCEIYLYGIGKIHCCYFGCCCHGNHPKSVCIKSATTTITTMWITERRRESGREERNVVLVFSYFRRKKLAHEFVCWNRAAWAINRINLQSYHSNVAGLNYMHIYWRKKTYYGGI